MRRGALAALTIGLASCSDPVPQPVPPYSVRAIDLGNGYLALLSDAGTLRVVKDREVVFETAPGVPLFSSAHDAEAPGDFHDPTDLTKVTLNGIENRTVIADSPAPGQLHLVVPNQSADTVLVSIAFARDGGFVSGLGERFDHVSATGRISPMYLAVDGQSASGTNETHVPIPFFVSSRGYGLFVASREAGAFDLGATDQGVSRATFEGSSMEVTLFFDPDPLAVVAAYTKKTGLPRRPADWALAPMHWRNEWPDAATLFSDADAYRKLKIPASTIWIDNPWQTSYNTAKLDPTRFGDPKALMDGIAAKGFRTIAWSTPYLERPKGKPADEAQELYQVADKAGYFVSQPGGGTWSAIGCCYKGLGMIDFTNPKARDFWEGVLQNATLAGFSGFKLDYGEDLVPAIIGLRLGTLRSDGETERTARTYPIGYHATYHAALDKVRKDGFLLGRASSWGGQTVVDAIWPGDLDNDFSAHTPEIVGGLKAAIVGAQNLSVSGFPCFGSDTGGYRGGKPDREVLLRWAEHTAFSMILQLGGGGDHHNPWLYDDEAGKIYAKLAREHNRLNPYLGNLATAASTKGIPTIRPLPLAFPKDQIAVDFADTEYMLGPDLLVAPVVDSGKTGRLVHFPEGVWVHWLTGDIVKGPTDRQVDAPLGTPPVFARAGAALPLLPIDIDTLVEASEPGIVTRSSRASDVEARAFVMGHEDVKFEEGSTIAVGDAAGEVDIHFTPVAPVKRLVIEMDLRSSTLGAGSGIVVKSSGSNVPMAPDAHACTDTCYAKTATGVALALVGETRIALTR